MATVFVQATTLSGESNLISLERIFTTAGDNRVPLPTVLETTSPLNRAMENFDRNESALAGTGSTHDTILVLFSKCSCK